MSSYISNLRDKEYEELGRILYEEIISKEILTEKTTNNYNDIITQSNVGQILKYFNKDLHVYNDLVSFMEKINS